MEEDDLKIGDKVVCISNIGGGLNLPLKINKIYTYVGHYNNNGQFISLGERKCLGHGYDIDRFVTLQEYRKLKLEKIETYK